jgi:hypothetical protein
MVINRPKGAVMHIIRIILVVILLTIGGHATAQQSVPPPIDIAVPHVTQDTDYWCWLAVAQMILTQRMNYSDPQCTLIERWDNHPPGNCCGDLRQCQRYGINLQEIQALLESEGVHSRYGSPILPNALYSLLTADMPVIAQVRYGNITHAVIIRGLRYERGIAVLRINDPQRCAPHEVRYDDFTVNWIDSLVITH